MNSNNDFICGTDFIELPALKGCKVLSDRKNLERMIKSANIMEVPDIVNWVQPGEVLITTAYPYRNRPKEFVKVIGDLGKVGIACLAIKPKRYIDSISQEIIDKANEVNILLIELGPDAVFANIVYETVQAISYKSMWEYLEVQRQINRVLSNIKESDSIEIMLDVLEQEISFPLFIMDVEGKILASKKMDIEMLNSLQEERSALYQMAIKTSEFLFEENRFYSKILSAENTLILFVYIQNGSMAESTKRLIENVAPLLQLQVRNNNAFSKKMNEYRNRFILDWARGSIYDKSDIMLTAQEYGMELKRDDLYQVALIGMGEKVENADVAMNRMRHFFRKMKAQFYIAYDEGGFVVILDAENKSSEWDEMVKGQNLKVYLSNPRAIDEVSVSYKEAKKIHEVTKKCNMVGKIFQYSDLGIYSVLSLLPKNQETKDYAKHYFGALKSYDKEHNQKLADSLKVYMLSGCNCAKAAEQLYIHYNTMSYRLEKIKRVLELDIDDIETRLEIQLAIKLDSIE